MREPTKPFTVRKPREAVIAVVITAVVIIALGAIAYYTLTGAALEPLILTLLGVGVVSGVIAWHWYKQRKAEVDEHKFVLHRQERFRDDLTALRGEVKALENMARELHQEVKKTLAMVYMIKGQLDLLDQGEPTPTNWQALAAEVQAELMQANGRPLRIVRDQ